MRGFLWSYSCVMVAILALAGCDRPEAAPPSGPAAPADPLQITQPNPRLPTMKLWIGAAELQTELALNNTQRMTGMMYRTNLAENAGMLFVFPVPHRTGFWMKNTPVPLSAAYIDPEGVIQEIHDLEPFNTNSVMAASDQIQYVLEVNRGWFERNRIGTGTVIRTERGTLRETFFPARL